MLSIDSNFMHSMRVSVMHRARQLATVARRASEAASTLARPHPAP
jgi:hypothetical protein